MTLSAYHTPSTPCPYCASTCDADWVDVGVGMVQCGPYYCHNCKASEIGPCDAARVLSPEEKATGWYAPFSEPGSSANVIGGAVVSASVMRDAYAQAFTNNPDYHMPGAVDAWYETMRQPGTAQSSTTT